MRNERDFSQLIKMTSNGDTKIHIVTHTDLDGAGAVVLFKQFFRNVDVTYAHNNVMSKKIVEAVENHQKYDYIVVTDISPTLEDAANIEFMEGSKKLILLDHHETSRNYLKHYKWAVNHQYLETDSPIFDRYLKGRVDKSADFTDEQMEGILASGTSMALDYLLYCFKGEGEIHNISKMVEFATLVTLWDTWAWQNVFNMGPKTRPPMLNNIFHLYGKSIFTQEYASRIYNDEYNDVMSMWFTEKEELMLSIDAYKKSEYVGDVIDDIKATTIDMSYFRPDGGGDLEDICILYVYAHQYYSDVFAEMSKIASKENYECIVDGKKYPITFFAIVNGSTVSLRSTPKGIYHAGNFAAIFGGGGHKDAAGIPFSDDDKLNYLKQAFKLN